MVDKKKKYSGKVEVKTSKMNPWRQNRKPPALPENVQSFQFKEIDGIKVLQEPSNHTASVIRSEGPILESELIQAMTYCQRSSAKSTTTVPIVTLRSKFPMIDKYLEDDQVQSLVLSAAGKTNARKEAIHILSERLQIPPHTIERYFRKATVRKRAEDT